MQPWLAPTGMRCRRWLNKSWAGFERSSFRSRDQKQVPTFAGGLVFCLRACSLNLGHAVHSTSATRFLLAVVPILCVLNAAAAGATCADFISRRRWVKLFAIAAKLLAEAEACKRASRRTFPSQPR